MSSFHFGTALPAICSVPHHNKLLEKELEFKASALATAYDSLSSSDSESVAPSLFVPSKNDDGVGSKNTTDRDVTTQKSRPPKEGSGVELVDTKNNVDDMNSDGASVRDNKLKSVPKKAVSSKPRSDNDEWKNPITKRDLRLQQLKEAIARKKRSTVKRSENFRPGRLVSCCRKKVSTSIPKGKRQDGKRQTRKKVYGIIIKRSELNENTWLVKFTNGALWYCHFTTLVYESQKYMDDRNLLTRAERDMMEKDRIKQMAQDHEDLLKPVLFPIVLLLPSSHVISV